MGFVVQSDEKLTIITVATILLLPKMSDSAVKQANYANHQIVDLIDQAQSTAMNNINLVLMSSDIQHPLRTIYPGYPSVQETNILNLSLHRVISSQDFIQYIEIHDTHGNIFNSIAKSDLRLSNFIDSNWFKQIQSSTHSSGFAGIFPAIQQTSSGNFNYQLMAYASQIHVGSQKFTVLAILNVKPMVDAADLIAAGYLDSYTIVSLDNKFIYSNQPELFSKNQSLFSGLAKYYTTEYSDQAGYYFLRTVKGGNWKIVSYVSRHKILSTYIDLFSLTMILFAGLAILTILIITPVIYHIINPINSLANTMKQVSDGNLDLQSEIDTNDEIGDLSQIFNDMVDSINNYIKRIYEREELEQRMKYSLLISQIDPHFIYNTMVRVS